MAAEIVPRWEWRTFGSDFGAAEEALGALAVERVEESDDLYLLFRDGDATVKVRDGLLDVKGLLAVDDDGLEQWVPVVSTRSRCRATMSPPRSPGCGSPRRRSTATPTPPSELLDEVVRPIDALLAVVVHKRRAHYTVGGCMAELSELRTDEGSTRSLAVESEDPARVLAAVRSLGLAARANVCMVRGLKALIGFGTMRYAVDRRRHELGQAPRRRAPRRRHVERGRRPRDRHPARRGPRRDRRPRAGADGADAGRDRGAGRRGARAGAVAIAAVGTAGLRAAANAAEFVERRRGALRRPDRDHPRRGGGPPRLPRGHDGARPRPRLARGLRHRRRQLAVHLRRRGRGRRAVQRAGRRGRA